MRLWIHQRPTTMYKTRIDRLVSQRNKCINTSGNYFRRKQIPLSLCSGCSVKILLPLIVPERKSTTKALFQHWWDWAFRIPLIICVVSFSAIWSRLSKSLYFRRILLIIELLRDRWVPKSLFLQVVLAFSLLYHTHAVSGSLEQEIRSSPPPAGTPNSRPGLSKWVRWWTKRLVRLRTWNLH